MIYTNSNLYIDSDFEIRTVREFQKDLDLLIPTDNRTINLYLDQKNSFLSSRMQFPSVKNILIRLSTSYTNNTATIHLLRTIDLNSSIVNFEMMYDSHMIVIRNKEFYIDFRFEKILLA